MADNSLNEILVLINQQLHYQETLNNHLSKAEALAHVALCSDFLDCPKSIIHDYLWILGDTIERAKASNTESLSALFKHSSQKLLVVA